MTATGSYPKQVQLWQACLRANEPAALVWPLNISSKVDVLAKCVRGTNTNLSGWKCMYMGYLLDKVGSSIHWHNTVQHFLGSLYTLPFLPRPSCLPTFFFNHATLHYPNPLLCLSLLYAEMLLGSGETPHLASYITRTVSVLTTYFHTPSELFHANETKGCFFVFFFWAMFAPASTVAFLPHVYLTIIDRAVYSAGYRPTTPEEELPCKSAWTEWPASIAWTITEGQ